METRKVDLAIIVTCINSRYISRMLNSIILNNCNVSVLVVFINQGDFKPEIKNDNPLVIIRELINTRVTSSAARNVGIKYLCDSKIIFSYVMFPDDDSTYSDVFFNNFYKVLNKNENYLIDIYCEGTDKLFKPTKYRDGQRLSGLNYDAAMSVNMLVNYYTFMVAGLLDERLGAGARYGGGEDIDYYLRCCESTHNGFIYTKSIFCFHPSPGDRYSEMSFIKIIVRFINYGNGTIFTLFKHKMYLGAFKICARAIGGAFISLLKPDFRVSVAYFVSFFTRTGFLMRCILFRKRTFKS